jgi:hypothetical protein
MISAYLDALAGALRSDRSLARRLQQEVEDHLCEAVAADPAGDRLAAEQRAIAHFGDPQLIAAQFASVSLARQSRSAGLAVLVAIAAVFLAMKFRLAMYAALPGMMSGDRRMVAGIVGLIDRDAFWLSIALGIAGWVFVSLRPVPVAVKPAYGHRMRRCFLVCVAATGALIVSVLSDGVLTSLRLLAMGSATEFLIPILSMSIEIAGAGMLVLYLRRVTRQMAAAA